MALRQTQYHVFALPKELLVNLTFRNFISQERPSSPAPAEATKITDTTAARTCNVCPGTLFADVDDQRTHFRTDWHRYNVKARVSKKKVVSEAEFAILIESLDDSLSGSESEFSQEEGSSDSDAVLTLLAKTQGLIVRPSSPSQYVSMPQTAFTWFHSPPSTQIGVYRALFTSSIPPEQFVDELKAMQNGGKKGKRWAMFMVAGGHFAGLIARVSKSEDMQDQFTNTKAGQKKVIPDMEILRHKTFHRYTTRRKQGGSQSLNDNSKGNAKSAGAQLRRYGEQALRDDIRTLLSEWAEDIADCERVWLRASGANRRIFHDYNEAVVMKGDKRLRTFPFPTKRPTQSELSRCLIELTRVKLTHLTEEELKAQDEAYLKSLPKPKPKPVLTSTAASKEVEKAAPILSEEEMAIRDKWSRFIEMIKKGRLEAAKGFWEREGVSLGGVDITIPEWTEERVTTILQLATLNGQKDVVDWLLNDLKADPTLPVRATKASDDPKDTTEHDGVPAESVANTNRRAYDLAPDRATRDVFRRSADTHPEWWDWFGTAHVPSALSKEMEEERDSRLKSRRKGLKDKVREREAKEKEREEERESLEREERERQAEEEARRLKARADSNTTGPKKLGGANAKGTVESMAGLTPEMRARIERERRARAAEARLKALGERSGS